MCTYLNRQAIKIHVGWRTGQRVSHPSRDNQSERNDHAIRAATAAGRSSEPLISAPSTKEPGNRRASNPCRGLRPQPPSRGGLKRLDRPGRNPFHARPGRADDSAPPLIRSSPRPVRLPHRRPPGGQGDGVHHRRQQPCAESPAHVRCFEAVRRDGVLRRLHADGVPALLQPVPDAGLPDGVLQGERAHGGDGAAVADDPECSKRVFQLQRCPGGPPLEPGDSALRSPGANRRVRLSAPLCRRNPRPRPSPAWPSVRRLSRQRKRPPGKGPSSP